MTTLVTDGNNKTILVVDDEVALTQLNAEILRNSGYKVITANNATEALEACENQKFDILLSDVIMPGMNGFELSEKVKTKFPDIKIIIVSGYNEQINKINTSYDYIDLQLDKPVSNTQLLNVIEKLLSS